MYQEKDHAIVINGLKVPKLLPERAQPVMLNLAVILLAKKGEEIVGDLINLNVLTQLPHRIEAHREQ